MAGGVHPPLAHGGVMPAAWLTGGGELEALTPTAEIWDAHAQAATAWMRAHPPHRGWAPLEEMDVADGEGDVAKDVAEAVAVIVEPRKHEYLEFVLRNAAHFCSQSPLRWGLVVMHGTDNGDFAAGLVAEWPHARLHNLGRPNLTAAEYNHLLASPEFWAALPTRQDTVLIFQTDAMLFAPPPEWVEEYDYIGAPWSSTCFVCGAPVFPRQRCCGRKVDDAAVHALAPDLVGNGGLSIRRRAASLRAASHFRLDTPAAAADETRRVAAGATPREPLAGITSEDVFFATALSKTSRRRMAPRHVAAEWAIEQSLPPTLPESAAWAVGMHKAHAYHTPPVVSAMLRAYTMVHIPSNERWRWDGKV